MHGCIILSDATSYDKVISFEKCHKQLHRNCLKFTSCFLIACILGKTSATQDAYLLFFLICTGNDLIYVVLFPFVGVT